MTAKAERLQNAFTFFLTQISRNKRVPLSKKLQLKIINLQIDFHKTLYTVPKAQLLELVPEEARSQSITKSQQIYIHLIKKNEKDTIRLIMNIQKDLSTEELQSLMEEARASPMCRLKILLH